MRKVTIFILMSASLLVSACNTVKGLGRDIESVGEAGDRVTWRKDNLSYIGKIISYKKWTRACGVQKGGRPARKRWCVLPADGVGWLRPACSIRLLPPGRLCWLACCPSGVRFVNPQRLSAKTGRFPATSNHVCAVQSLMQQALFLGWSTHPIAPTVPTDFTASVPVIPTNVLDRRLHDATRITHMVICRKVVFAYATQPRVVMLNLFQHNGQPSLVILKQPVVMLNLFQHNEPPSLVILTQPVVMLNLVQHNGQRWLVILKQVQDDEGGGGGGRWGETMAKRAEDDVSRHRRN